MVNYWDSWTGFLFPEEPGDCVYNQDINLSQKPVKPEENNPEELNVGQVKMSNLEKTLWAISIPVAVTIATGIGYYFSR
jgi:hypothetical protein